MSTEIPTPEGVIWWELPCSAGEVIEQLEIGARAAWCWDVQWIYVDGVGWVDA
jgi:hypothetical protein